MRFSSLQIIRDTGQRRTALLVLLLLFGAAFAGQAVTADTAGSAIQTGETYPGPTLISVQDYEYGGRLIEVRQDGTVNWEFDPPNSRVFDAEYLYRLNCPAGQSVISLHFRQHRDNTDSPL